MNTLQLAKLKQQLLKEIQIVNELGDASKDPYKYTRDGSDLSDFPPSVKFYWQTENGVKYKATIFKFEQFGKKSESIIYDYDVMFGIIGEDDYTTDYDATNKDTKTGNMFNIMSTMIKIINDEINIDKKEGIKINSIVMEPTKRSKISGSGKDPNDTRRAQLYLAYINKNMPKGSTVKMDKLGKKITIKLPS
jgi:hypothetical protein